MACGQQRQQKHAAAKAALLLLPGLCKRCSGSLRRVASSTAPVRPCIPYHSVMTAYTMAVSKATKLMRQLLRQYRCAAAIQPMFSEDCSSAGWAPEGLLLCPATDTSPATTGARTCHTASAPFLFCRGYECKEPEPGKLTLAFRQLEDALQWGCALQQELLGFAWPESGVLAALLMGRCAAAAQLPFVPLAAAPPPPAHLLVQVQPSTLPRCRSA